MIGLPAGKRQPTTTGLIVLRTFAPEPVLMDVAKASLNGAKCENPQ